MEEIRAKKTKQHRIVGEYGVVDTGTKVYDNKDVKYALEHVPEHLLSEEKQDLYDVKQRIVRYEPTAKQANLVFVVYYFKDKDGKRGRMHFFPRLYGSGSEFYFYDWNFKLEFSKDNHVDKFCRIEMNNGFNSLHEEIDIYTFSLLMTRFFESCDPNFPYDFKDVFIDVFQNSKYENLQKFAESSSECYNIYRKNLKIQQKLNEKPKGLLLRKWKK